MIGDGSNRETRSGVTLCSRPERTEVVPGHGGTAETLPCGMMRKASNTTTTPDATQRVIPASPVVMFSSYHGGAQEAAVTRIRPPVSVGPGALEIETTDHHGPNPASPILPGPQASSSLPEARSRLLILSPRRFVGPEHCVVERRTRSIAIKGWHGDAGIRTQARVSEGLPPVPDPRGPKMELSATGRCGTPRALGTPRQGQP